MIQGPYLHLAILLSMEATFYFSGYVVVSQWVDEKKQVRHKTLIAKRTKVTAGLHVLFH